MKILFLHGWQSVSGGVNPTFLAQHSHEVVNPKLPDEDFSEAVSIAQPSSTSISQMWSSCRHGAAQWR